MTDWRSRVARKRLPIIGTSSLTDGLGIKVTVGPTYEAPWPYSTVFIRDLCLGLPLDLVITFAGLAVPS